MPALHDVLVAFADRPDVAAAMVVSDEGLTIDAVIPGGGIEAEAAAALAATAQRSLAGLGEALGHGTPREVLLEGPDGVAVLRRMRSGVTLLVVAAENGDLGALLHDLRLHGPALSELV